MYPISYEADFNPEPNRWTTFFRILLAIPWLVVGIFWAILFVFTHLIAWVAIIVLGRYPQWLYDFNSGVIRYGIRTSSWVVLQTDVWPPFGISDDPAYPIRVNVPPPAERQSRLKALFRPILALPIIVIVAIVDYIFRFIGLAAWLTIVFRGYLPEWLFSTLAHVHSLETRAYGYVAFLTDDYPPVGPERATSAAAPAGDVVPPPPPPPPPAQTA
ncbi:MAG TPA: DUF4389 domain-containing protein [Solirubrobacterales bacterium]|nr:DUF4389 domain-containing protein [Solirubrobacterales bacterium]